MSEPGTAPRFIVRDKWAGNDNLPAEAGYPVTKLRYAVVDTMNGRWLSADFETAHAAQVVCDEINSLL